MAVSYAMFHGAKGLTEIALGVAQKTKLLADLLQKRLAGTVSSLTPLH